MKQATGLSVLRSADRHLPAPLLCLRPHGGIKRLTSPSIMSARVSMYFVMGNRSARLIRRCGAEVKHN